MCPRTDSHFCNAGRALKCNIVAAETERERATHKSSVKKRAKSRTKKFVDFQVAARENLVHNHAHFSNRLCALTSS